MRPSQWLTIALVPTLFGCAMPATQPTTPSPGGEDAARPPMTKRDAAPVDTFTAPPVSPPDAVAPTTDGQQGDGTSALDTGVGPMTTDGLQPAVMGVGYGALRVLSFDGGKTWTGKVVLDPDGGDDANLIRAVGWGNGVWVAAGWKIFTSRDGRTWKEIPESQVPGQWYDCVTYKDGRFIVKVIRADRGGQSGEAIVSADQGATWQKAAGATTCHASLPFQGDGYQLKGAWRGKILRSDDGNSWQTVYQDCCSVQAFAVGMAAPRP